MIDKKNFLTVKEVNQYIKNLLDGDSLLSNLWVKGEISNFTAHSSGHFYFTLKDPSGSIRCVMFKSRSQKLPFKPEHGMEVFVTGYISVYERDGQYQLYVEDMLPLGAGALNIAYEQLKEKLTKEGLFSQDKKRALPFLPTTIGIVTSITGAALRDMVSIIQRRSPQIKIIIVPALVQGQEGSKSICLALDKIYQQAVDVIIIGRGGGSLEELWVFNEEAVVRKINSSPVPIVSAVGHETDFTLSDFSADMRAATPSMAAELVVPLKSELCQRHRQYQKRISTALNKLLSQERQRVSFLASRYVLREPLRILANFQQDLDSLNNRLLKSYQLKLKDELGIVHLIANKLDALSPLKTLRRGYSISYGETGKVIKDIDEVHIEEKIEVVLGNGRLFCMVKEKKGRKYEEETKL